MVGLTGLAAPSVAHAGTSGIFGGGPFYINATNNINEIKNAGFTEVVVWNIQIRSNGDLNFNGEFPLVSNGAYIGAQTHADFASNMALLKTGTVKRLTFSIGSSNVGDFQNLKALVNAQGTGPSSILYRNFAALKAAIPSIDAFDLDDENSYVNGLDDYRYAELVGAFNFDSDGNLSDDPTGTVQQRGDVLETVDFYLQQTLESDQGDSNTGVRLALYFERKAPDISSAYDILGDSALFEFFTTSFNLSSYVSNMDVDKQAEMVENFIDLKDLSDPDKVQDLIKRFTAMYDVANGTNTSSPALSILDTSSAGVSADTLLAVAQLKN